LSVESRHMFCGILPQRMTRAKRTRTSSHTASAAGPATRPRTREWVLAKVPADLRQQVDRWANEWLRTKFDRLLELRAADPGPFNYPVQVFSEWRGKAFYLCVRYRTGQGRPQGDFVPRWTPQIRPLIDTSNPAIVGARDKWSSTSPPGPSASRSAPWCASFAART